MEALGILSPQVFGGALRRRGSGWRPVATQQGLAANTLGYGTLTELPDWFYADGRPAPPMKGQLRRKAQREKFARRVVLLSQEWMLDYGMAAQAAGEVAEEEKEAEECS
ncbi:39S ribosomal protein L52; mitochondrial [Camelus dromedarius]|uniref:Large ribosomal subunit protein mL52 n=1 Tax=Camelus dromedarius TaxID=9838 RepID=A0A5N4E1P1_CAMDR|nr:39S ribosomal protein L52; mitochondrial [Camelus dromedarius]